MARTPPGRHRAPGFNPLNELGDIAARSTQPALKASAVVVASGGLVAAFAIPASASPASDSNTNVAVAASLAAVPESFSVAAPAATTTLPTFGLIGFTGTAAVVPAASVVQIATVVAPAAPAAPAAPVAKVAAPVAKVAAPVAKVAAPVAKVAAPVAKVVAAVPSVAAAPVARAARAAVRPPVAPAPAPAPRPAPAPAPQPAPAAAPAPTGGILGIAASLGGIPYKWGGTTPAGFDCSGFTGYVYQRVGKSIPRVAEAQRQAATKVSNPVPGDLIFFGYPAYHVGIYAGGGKMYDSQRPGTLSGLHVIWTQTNVSYGRF